jgi:hypothetical protein
LNTMTGDKLNKQAPLVILNRNRMTKIRSLSDDAVFVSGLLIGIAIGVLFSIVIILTLPAIS